MNWLVRTLMHDRTVAPISRPTMAVICGWFGAGCSLVVGRSIGVDVDVPAWPFNAAIGGVYGVNHELDAGRRRPQTKASAGGLHFHR